MAKGSFGTTIKRPSFGQQNPKEGCSISACPFRCEAPNVEIGFNLTASILLCDSLVICEVKSEFFSSPVVSCLG